VNERQDLYFGRRRGRPLRAAQRERRETLLPRLSFHLPPIGPLDPASLFAVPPRDVWLEIGFGGGEHLAEQAGRHPEIGFVGCDVFENGIVKLLGEIDRRSLSNIRIYPDDARPLLTALTPRSIGRVFILFPDPWPKARHHKRRLIAPAMLDRLGEIMTDRAELRLATDDADYLAWMREQITSHPTFVWTAHPSPEGLQRPPDWPATRYEEKARSAGRTPVFLRCERRPRARLSEG
jgi:tRNA (guanine-N7-)-methyltransferase